MKEDAGVSRRQPQTHTTVSAAIHRVSHLTLADQVRIVPRARPFGVFGATRAPAPPPLEVARDLITVAWCRHASVLTLSPPRSPRMQNPETTMGFPEGTITYDDVVLAGHMSPEQVAACIGAGAKSWVYMNDVSHAACPKAAVEGASLPFECIPLTSPNDITPALVDTFIAALDAAPKPLVIQCNTATRAGIPSSSGTRSATSSAPPPPSKPPRP